MDYTDLYNFLTDSGIIVPNDSEVLAGIQTKFQEIFGTDIDLSAETPVGRLIETMSIVVKTTLGVTAQSANQFNVYDATGIYLDAIGQIYDLKRTGATRSRMTVKCYFTSDRAPGDVIIPAGSLIMSGSDGTLFELDGDVSSEDQVEEAETGRYYSVGAATAMETGPIVCPAGTLDSIQTGVLGWVGVSTISMSYIGTAVETDESFRQRIIKSRTIGVGFNDSLTSSLNRIKGIYSSIVLENNTAFAKMIRGVNVPSHSIYVGADFIDTEEIRKEIASAIANSKPVGIGMSKYAPKGSYLIEQQIDYGYNHQLSQDIFFTKVKRTPVSVNVSYFIGNYAGMSINQDIVRVVTEYIDNVGVGGTIYGSMMATELSQQLNIGINHIMVQKSGDTTSANSVVEMDGYETPYCVSENIVIST